MLSACSYLTVYIYIVYIIVYIYIYIEREKQNRNRNNKEMSENVFSRESNTGLLVTGQMPYHWATEPTPPFSRIGRTFIKWQALRRITHFLQLGSRHSAQVDQRFTVNFPQNFPPENESSPGE